MEKLTRTRESYDHDNDESDDSDGKKNEEIGEAKQDAGENRRNVISQEKQNRMKELLGIYKDLLKIQELQKQGRTEFKVGIQKQVEDIDEAINTMTQRESQGLPRIRSVQSSPRYLADFDDYESKNLSDEEDEGTPDEEEEIQQTIQTKETPSESQEVFETKETPSGSSNDSFSYSKCVGGMVLAIIVSAIIIFTVIGIVVETKK